MTPIPATRRRTSAKQKARQQAATGVVGYLRCSTDEQTDSGLGLDAQRAAVESACAAKGWTVTEWAVDESVSGSVGPADRPAMARALRLLDGCEAGALVAARVDRIARDLHDLTGLLRRADDDGWAIVALDLGVDTTTPVGRMLVGILGSVAEWERATIRQRTRDALAAKKANGARLGRPVSAATQPARARLRELLHHRLTFAAIASTLNAEGYTTPTGLAWTWRHVQKTRDSLALDDLASRHLSRSGLTRPPPLPSHPGEGNRGVDPFRPVAIHLRLETGRCTNVNVKLKALLLTILLSASLAVGASSASAAGTGPLWFSPYCDATYAKPQRSLFNPVTSNAVLVQNNVRGWRCFDYQWIGAPFGWIATASHNIDVNAACRFQYGSRSSAGFRNANDAYSWFCYT